MSLGSPRRATSMAMIGAMPVAKPVTAFANVRKNPISDWPFSVMVTVMGLR